MILSEAIAELETVGMDIKLISNTTTPAVTGRVKGMMGKTQPEGPQWQRRNNQNESLWRERQFPKRRFQGGYRSQASRE